MLNELKGKLSHRQMIIRNREYLTFLSYLEVHNFTLSSTTITVIGVIIEATLSELSRIVKSSTSVSNEV